VTPGGEHRVKLCSPPSADNPAFVGVVQRTLGICPKGVFASLVVDHANEANTATDETPAEGVFLRVLWLVFLCSREFGSPMTRKGAKGAKGFRAFRGLSLVS
jgi:hypothetical protein